jgi:RecA/RadA recombinase
MSRESSRWNYTLGSRPEGVIVYDDGQKIHIHHDTDKARGQQNSFDLCRIHLYGDLDNGVDDSVPMTERPSFKAMAAFASTLPEVQAVQAAQEFDVLPELTPEELAAAPKPKDPNRFAVISAGEFVGRPPMPWIVKGVLPQAGLAVIYGESGSGKSFLVLDLITSIQRGVDWRGHRVAPCRCVMVVAEGVGGFRQRINAYVKQHEVDISEMPGVVPDAPNLLLLDDTDALIRGVKAHGSVGIVVIDTLSAVSPGSDENSAEGMGKVLHHCHRIHKETNALIILIHHSGKDASRGARGWSGLKAAADVEIEVSRNGEFRKACLTKLKDGEDGAEWNFKLVSVPLGFDEDDELISSCVIEHTDASPMRGKKPPTGLKLTVFMAAQELMAPGDVKPVFELLDKAILQMPHEEGKRDIRRQHANRALQRLITEGYLFLPTPDTVSLISATAVSPATFEGQGT